MLRVLVAVVCLLALGLPALAQGEAGAEQAKQIEGWIEQLADADAGVRRNAADALGWAGSKAAPAVPALIKAL